MQPLPGVAGLLTQHGKEALLAPLFARELGVEVRRVCGFDTDALGTFDGEVARAGTQRDAARAKARLAIALSALPSGLGSEGSFGTDPVTGLLPWNRELILWIDAASGLEVAGYAHGPAMHAQGTFERMAEVRAFAAENDFPRHGCVLSAQVEGVRACCRDVSTEDGWHVAARDLLARADDGRLRVETDLRAHRNPTRQAMILRACEDLVRRLTCACPACNSRGYGRSHAVIGLPCAECDARTDVAWADEWACPACGHTALVVRVGEQAADASHCGRCNP